jgi:sporulation protein YlmC with PRC-barrel domain
MPPAETATQEPPVTPPPSDAIISAEAATDMRADKLIGTSVYNAEGQEVGSVQDIVFDKDGKIVGVVLKVGGLFGIGGKSVGIKWDEVQVMPQEGTVKVNYSEDQLKVVPAFKTQDAIAAEQPAAPMAPASRRPRSSVPIRAAARPVPPSALPGRCRRSAATPPSFFRASVRRQARLTRSQPEIDNRLTLQQ